MNNFNEESLLKKITKNISTLKENIKSNFFKIKVDKDKNIIIITGLNFNNLMKRIKELYKDKKLTNIFDKTYSEKSIKLFENKKINKGQMKIDEISFSLFFALEVSILFKELYERYGFILL